MKTTPVQQGSRSFVKAPSTRPGSPQPRSAIRENTLALVESFRCPDGWTPALVTVNLIRLRTFGGDVESIRLVGADLAAGKPILPLLDAALGRFGRRPAVSDTDGYLTFAELDAESRGLAAELLAVGVGAAQRVVIQATTSRWAIVAMLAVLRAGAQYVPVDRLFPRQRQEDVIAASGASCRVVESGQPHEGRSPLRITGATARSSEPPSGVGPTGPSPAYTLFTSGSTGTPKGVVVTHDNLGYSTRARIRYYPEAPSTYLLCSSISFDSSVAGIYWSLVTGAHLVIPARNPLDVEAIVTAAYHHRGSHILLLPSLYEAVLDTAGPGLLDSLRTVIVAGEPCLPRLVLRHFAQLPGAALYNEYGPTEGTVWSMVHRCRPTDADGADVPIGRPIPGTTVHIDLDGGRAGSPTGELRISGPGVAAGYATGTGAVVPFPVVDGTRSYRTGDIVGLDAENLVHFGGRTDSQLKIGGLRIELAEIEQAIVRRTGGRPVAVGIAGRGSPVPGLVAFVAGADVGESLPALRRLLRDDLPRGAVPARWQTVEQLPRLPNGKLDRAAVDRMAADHLRRPYPAEGW
ncbi:amino acid adenylation domain-containing protein [Micromonospora wenchangensis]|uniref:amino acid adenylation domain-containing protein n=1 Tax=Micromonospora wenchangensis TaxID=1185415 RepID=UPI0034483E87